MGCRVGVHQNIYSGLGKWGCKIFMSIFIYMFEGGRIGIISFISKMIPLFERYF